VDGTEGVAEVDESVEPELSVVDVVFEESEEVDESSEAEGLDGVVLEEVSTDESED
jgi:hypothetical protein